MKRKHARPVNMPKVVAVRERVATIRPRLVGLLGHLKEVRHIEDQIVSEPDPGLLVPAKGECSRLVEFDLVIVRGNQDSIGDTAQGPSQRFDERRDGLSGRLGQARSTSTT